MNTAYDPMDKLIADHIAEARDLRLHLRPAYAGMEHHFSAEFEHKMIRLRQHGHSEWLTRLILVAILTALCAMTVQAGLGNHARWQFSLDNGSQTQFFTITGSHAEVQAGDIAFRTVPAPFIEGDRQYERSSYTVRFIAEGQTLPTRPNQLTDLTVTAHWVGNTQLNGSYYNKRTEAAELVPIGASNALLITQQGGMQEMIFALDGFEVNIHTSALDKAALIAFAEGIYFK